MRKIGRLILYAEMKVPGEAWLELEVNDKNKTFLQKQHLDQMVCWEDFIGIRYYQFTK